MLKIGTRVAVKDTYRDPELQVPVVGTVKDVFFAPDWNARAFVVMFDDVGASEPPGGEFTSNCLVPLGA